MGPLSNSTERRKRPTIKRSIIFTNSLIRNKIVIHQGDFVGEKRWLEHPKYVVANRMNKCILKSQPPAMLFKEHCWTVRKVPKFGNDLFMGMETQNGTLVIRFIFRFLFFLGINSPSLPSPSSTVQHDPAPARGERAIGKFLQLLRLSRDEVNPPIEAFLPAQDILVYPFSEDIHIYIYIVRHTSLTNFLISVSVFSAFKTASAASEYEPSM